FAAEFLKFLDGIWALRLGGVLLEVASADHQQVEQPVAIEVEEADPTAQRLDDGQVPLVLAVAVAPVDSRLLGHGLEEPRPRREAEVIGGVGAIRFLASVPIGFTATADGGQEDRPGRGAGQQQAEAPQDRSLVPGVGVHDRNLYEMKKRRNR